MFNLSSESFPKQEPLRKLFDLINGLSIGNNNTDHGVDNYRTENSKEEAQKTFESTQRGDSEERRESCKTIGNGTTN
jgi:hypothetical protein